LSGPEFPVYRRNEGSHVFQAHQVERKRFRAERTPTRAPSNSRVLGVWMNRLAATSPNPEVPPVITMVFI